MRILLADDERAIRTVLELHMRRHGWDVDAVEDGDEALACAKEHSHDVLVLDQRMPGLSGIEVARQLDTDAPIVIYSAYLDADLHKQAEDLGCHTIPKADISDLITFLEGVEAT